MTGEQHLLEWLTGFWDVLPFMWGCWALVYFSSHDILSQIGLNLLVFFFYLFRVWICTNFAVAHAYFKPAFSIFHNHLHERCPSFVEKILKDVLYLSKILFTSDIALVLNLVGSLFINDILCVYGVCIVFSFNMIQFKQFTIICSNIYWTEQWFSNF